MAGIALAAVATLGLAGCSSSGPEVEQKSDGTLTVVAHDSIAIDEDLLAQFEQDSGLKVTIVNAGSALEVASKVALTQDDPIGDVVVGISSDDASRVATDDILVPYVSTNSGDGSQDFAYDDSDLLTAFDRGDVCMNLDDGWFKEHGVEEPTTLDDLVKPEYQDLTVVASPAASSVGLSFLLATIGEYGEDGWQDYWEKLQSNGLKVASDWEDTYYNEFSFSGEGDRPIALSYSSSPAATVNDAGTETGTSAMLDTCYRQVEYAGILANSPRINDAKKFIDFLLSPELQATIPDSMYMYPVDASAEVPKEWTFAPAPSEDQEITLDSQKVVENRDQWVSEWSSLFGG